MSFFYWFYDHLWGEYEFTFLIFSYSLLLQKFSRSVRASASIRVSYRKEGHTHPYLLKPHDLRSSTSCLKAALLGWTASVLNRLHSRRPPAPSFPISFGRFGMQVKAQGLILLFTFRIGRWAAALSTGAQAPGRRDFSQWRGRCMLKWSVKSQFYLAGFT